jgi:hypothetical protein
MPLVGSILIDRRGEGSTAGGCHHSSGITYVHWIRAARTKGYEMRKGFTRKPKPDEPATPVKNYITPT